MGYGDHYWGLYRDYYRDPFPGSLLSPRQSFPMWGVKRSIRACPRGWRSEAEKSAQNPTIGGLIIRIGFWGHLYYNYNKEPAK